MEEIFSIVLSFTSEQFSCVCYLSCNQSLPKLFSLYYSRESRDGDDGLPWSKEKNIQKDNSILSWEKYGWAKVKAHEIFFCEKEIWKIVVTRSCVLSYTAIEWNTSFLIYHFSNAPLFILKNIFFFCDSFIDNLPERFVVPIFVLSVCMWEMAGAHKSN